MKRFSIENFFKAHFGLLYKKHPPPLPLFPNALPEKPNHPYIFYILPKNHHQLQDIFCLEKNSIIWIKYKFKNCISGLSGICM